MDGLYALIPILALSIPIVAIVAANLRKMQERKLTFLERQSADMGTAAGARIERLEARIEVLERIATDKRLRLADEIERLGN